tara:strand:- start:763 stop:1458 length:696 start_codon:yes stop_codon:yes gene_type:complete
MAISVDTVYQRVLAILNKEQRGFLTPQKFNLYANQIQLDILERYFYDLDLYLTQPGNSTTHADMVSVIQDKISAFEVLAGPKAFTDPYFELPDNLYRLTAVTLAGKEATKVTQKELIVITNSPLATPTDSAPIYTKVDPGLIILATTPRDANSPVALIYVRVPNSVVWAYTDVLGTPQYNASNSADFELDVSEETDLVVQILRLAGLEVRDLSTYEIANRMEATENAQEKQ